MTLPSENMQYPQRRHGMNQQRHAWSSLTDRPPRLTKVRSAI